MLNFSVDKPSEPIANAHADPVSENEQSTSEPEAPTVLIKDKTKNLDAFFHPAEKIARKPRRACMLCKSVHVFLPSMIIFLSILIGHYRSKGSTQTLVAEASTLRRHIEANHLVSGILFTSACY